MLDAIYTSLSGMNAYTKGLDVISNNVSNMNTPGFKLSAPLFRDLVYQFGGTIGNGNSSSQPTGAGVEADQSTLSMQQGQLQATGNSLDAAINGEGFFVLNQNGQQEYTRAGQFEFNSDGILVETGTGAKVVMSTDATASTFFDLNSASVYPPQATSTVTLSGSLMRADAGTTATTYSLPQIQVYDTTGASLQLTANFTPVTAVPAHATTQVTLSGTLAGAPADSIAPVIAGTDASFMTTGGTGVSSFAGGSYTSGTVGSFDYSVAATAGSADTGTLPSLNMNATSTSIMVDGNLVSLNSDYTGNLAGLVADIQSQLNTSSAGVYSVTANGGGDGITISKITTGSASTAPVITDISGVAFTGNAGFASTNGSDGTGESFTVDGHAINLSTNDTDIAGLVSDVQTQLDGYGAGVYVASNSGNQLIITKAADGAVDARVAYSMPIQIFDTTGTPMQASLKLTPDASNPLLWNVDVVDANGNDLGSGSVGFNSDGTPASGSSSVSVHIAPPTGTAFDVNFDFGTPGASSGVTSATGTTASALQLVSQDGTAAVTADPLHWKVDILDANNVVQGSGDVIFNADGTPATGTSSFTVTIKPATGPTFDVKFDFGAPGTYAGVTSVTGTTASQLQVLKQDGFALGTVTATAFDSNGNLTITYSNGQTKTPAKLVLAQFDSPSQLKALDGAHFAAVGSQQPILGAALSSGMGNIVGGQIEMSNVDLTNQFTDLIIVQRGFQGCSQITTVANEMMQQLLSMSSGKE